MVAKLKQLGFTVLHIVLQIHYLHLSYFSLFSRDMATLDEEGYCRIVGRIKELIIAGGRNIYPVEIEKFLHTHPKVEDVHVSLCLWE